MSEPAPTLITEDEVMFYDTDCGQVVHNLAYLRMLERCRTKLAAEKMGMDLAAMAEQSLFPVVVNINVNYKMSALYGDTIVTTGRLSKLDRVRFYFDFEMRRQSNNDLLITSQHTLALVEMPGAKIQRLPADWRDRWTFDD
ncbi:acyl-CoA thioesterase [Persicirhabdus sediminis]|uniref:Acyl-CoA thioesterase n=1 Tax=Persicirhabdus sediminis TaxID=454144 RepID=A0A8J7MH41_9BACT|nr:thioesterase family protein [Persicirhabdus sediminis]MBK1792827.1 acyl-CoA thioesterase [Persicirhabdus sediminis]